MKKFIAVVLFCLGGQQLIAQEQFKCGLTEKLLKLYAEDPQLEKDHAALFAQGKSVKGTIDGKMVVFTIPVVFHIIHNYGVENIGDDQVYDQMDILNRDYRLLNADTSLVINEFKNLYADIGIEFKLAAIDPSGNYTNGIEHIYSHETFNGDDYSKLHQWPRFNYLNIWIVDDMKNGVAGYAYYPSAVEGLGFFRDGIIIRHDYIGSIGTGSLYNSRALTHEVGHYLGLSHPWGSTNEPGVACGDDNIPDTPITRGSNLNCNLSMTECTVGVIENVQNYMDYSYCSRMFTIDQADAMRNILQGAVGQRNQLITPETAAVTGIDLTTPSLSKPIADFSVNKNMVCVGSSVQFKDQSYNATIASRLWNFYGDASIATSTAAQPSVSYSTPGYKKVGLTVTNANGSDTKEVESYIYVSNNLAEHYGPTSINLNNQYSELQFIVKNPEENHAKFQLVQTNGIDNSRCFKLNNYFNASDYFSLSNEGMYYNRLGGSVDELITPAYDLRYTTGVNFNFKYSYTTNANMASEITEVLKVYSSKNCGETWTLRKTISGAALVTNGSDSYSDRAPTDNTQWGEGSFNYTASSTDINTRFKFEFTASDLSGNLYIDNINVDGVLGIEELSDVYDVVLYPNPADEQVNVAFAVNSDADVTFTVQDVTGKQIKNELVKANQGDNTVSINTSDLASGMYFLNLGLGNTKKTIQFVVK